MDRDQVKSVVGSVFRGARRTWKGYGGVTNPKETWSDLKASLHTAFLLDTDSVFTVAAWAAARLVGLCDKITEISTDMRKAAGELRDPSDGIPDLAKINKAARRLRSVISSIRLNGNAAANPDARAEIRNNLIEFAQESLLPNVSPITDGTSRRSASEARKSLKEDIDLLLEAKADVADSVVRLAALLAVLSPRMPHLLASGNLQKATNILDEMRSRMIESRTVDRINKAEEDLTNVSAAIVALDLITRNPAPVLDRGGPYPVVAAASGSGAAKIGSVSAPYRLVSSVCDVVQLDVDGAPGGPILLPAPQDTIEIRFPRDEGVAPTFYTATVAWGLILAVNGTPGTTVVGAPGAYTAAAIAALINGTPGAIPLNPLLVPYLIVSAVPVGLAQWTVQLQWNPAAFLTTPRMDLGVCMQIVGTVEIMNVFGFTGSDPEYPTIQHHRTFWTPTRQEDVIASLTRSLGPGIVAEPDNQTLMSGIGWFDDGLPTYFYVWNFSGIGEFDLDEYSFVLTGENLAKVQVGDHVDIGPGWATARVIEKLPDGVKVDSWAGLPLPSGTYGITIYPEAATLFPGVTPTLHILANGYDVTYHVVGVANTGAGLQLQLSTELYVGAFFSTLGVGTNYVPYALRVDKLKVSSRNNGTTGALQFQAVAQDAVAYLGYDHSLTVSMVDQIEDSTADFRADGVKAGDLVIMPALPTNEVESITRATRVRLESDIPGPYSGTVRIVNARYQAYNDMVAALSWIVPTDEELRKLVLECIRAPDMIGAGAELTVELTSLELTTSTLKGVLQTYRSKITELSPYMKNIREALDESGADRAIALMMSGDLEALFKAEVDDASTERTVLRKIREASRKILGSSVYSNQLDAEAQAVLRDDQLLPDSEPLGDESFGPPRGS